MASRVAPLSPTAAERAATWLAGVLSLGPRSVTEVKALAADVGIRPRTLQRARGQLGVRSAPDGWQGQRMLSLPDSAGHEPPLFEPVHESEVLAGLPGLGVDFAAQAPRRVALRRVR